MSQIPLNPTPVSAASVESDIPCRKCSYNLRGLPLEGRCPECGTPVGVSVNGNLLRYSDPAFVQTLRRGVSFILWGILAIIVFSVIAVFLALGRVLRPDAVMLLVLGFLAALPMVIGSWLLTTPDPSGIGEGHYGTARKVIRISLVIGLFNNLIKFIAVTAGPLTAEMEMALKALEFVVSAVGLVGLVAQLAYLREMSFRIPDPSLSRRANSIYWGMGISYGMMLVMAFLIQVLAGGRIVVNAASPPLAFAGCFAGIIGIVVLIYGIMYLVMLAAFGRRFREQAAIARTLWQSHAPIIAK